MSITGSPWRATARSVAHLALTCDRSTLYRFIREALYPQLYNRDAEIRKNLCIVLAASGDSVSISQLDNLLQDRDAEVAQEASRAIRILRSRGM